MSTQTKTSGPGSNASVNKNSWQAQFLTILSQKTGLNIPINQTNIDILSAWHASDLSSAEAAQGSGSMLSNNPFKITGLWPGATTCIAQCDSSSPVYQYDTLQDGLTANAEFIADGYMNIAQALADTPSQSDGNYLYAAQAAGNVFQQINQSEWCKGCQNGNYPEQLKSLWNSWNLGTGDSAIGVATPTSGTKIAEDYVTTGAKNATKAVVGWADSLGTLLSHLTSVQFWQRVGLGALGVLLIVAGLLMILNQSKTVQVAEGVTTLA